MSEEIKIRCCITGEERTTTPKVNGSPRLPRNWKWHNGKIYSQKAWQQHYVLRSIVIPIAAPVGVEWPQLNEALKRAWRASTGLANWLMTELAKRDIIRTPEMTKMPAAPDISHAEISKQFPEMVAGTIAAMRQNLIRKYRKSRFDVIWTRSASLPSFRYPMPYPFSNISWKASRTEGGDRLVTFSLPGQRVTLRLRGGHQFARQLAAFDQLIADEAAKGELSIYRRRANSNDNRAGHTDRAAGGGNRQYYRNMVKMCLWVPKMHSKSPQSGTLHVRTDPASLLIYHIDKEPPKYIHADHAKRWIAAYRKQLQRLNDDTKAEKRRRRRLSLGLNEHRKILARKHANRMDSLCHETSISIAKYAVRRGVEAVEFDGSCHDFAEPFPWFKLAEMIEYKLAERNIEIRCKKAADAN